MPLTADRNTIRSLGEQREEAVAANAVIFAGALVMRNAAGFITRGAVAAGAVGVGRADERIDNTGGANGALRVKISVGTFRYLNSTGADAITRADIGRACWIADDDRVARTSATDTRSRAGIVDRVDDHGVWVRFDEALTRVATAAAA